jgi:opacity protein-like surface antigen
MKKLLTVALLAVATLPATAFADSSLTGEVRFSDPRGGRADSTEYRVEAWKKAFGSVLVGAELQARQPENEGKLTSKVSVKAGTELSEFAGFKPVAYTEVGQHLADHVSGGNFNFWGAGLKVSRPLTAGLTLNAGYRHREGFSDGNLKEDRLHGGISYALTKKTNAGVTYYRTRSGGNDTDAIGVGLTTKF